MLRSGVGLDPLLKYSSAARSLMDELSFMGLVGGRWPIHRRGTNPRR